VAERCEPQPHSSCIFKGGGAFSAAPCRIFGTALFPEWEFPQIFLKTLAGFKLFHVEQSAVPVHPARPDGHTGITVGTSDTLKHNQVSDLERHTASLQS
jgi:hypothetical protein